MQKKLTNLVFAGLFGVGTFFPIRSTVATKIADRDISMPPRDESTVSGENRNGINIKANIQERIQNFKNTRANLREVSTTAVGQSSLTVDNSGTGVTVNITSNTQLRRRFWGKSNLSEFSVGDKIDVVGRWTDDTKTAINAVLIRNLSIQKRFGVFFGTVKGLTADGFVMTTIQRGDESVTLGSAKLINRKQETITQADIKVGDRVRVRGLWDNNLKTITEVTEVKNFSLPPFGSHSPEPKESKEPKSTPVASSAPTVIPSPTPSPASSSTP